MHGLIVIVPVLVLGQTPQPPLAPWRSNHHPADVSKRHVEQVVAGRHVYTIRQGGTMDGTNCRSPLGVGMMDGPAIQRTWRLVPTTPLQILARSLKAILMKSP